MEQTRVLVETLLVETAHQMVFRATEFHARMRIVQNSTDDIIIRSQIDTLLERLPNGEEEIVETKGSRGVQNWLLDLWGMINEQEAALEKYEILPV